MTQSIDIGKLEPQNIAFVVGQLRLILESMTLFDRTYCIISIRACCTFQVFRITGCICGSTIRKKN